MDNCDIVYSTSQKAVKDIQVETSSITHSQAEDQDLHEDRGDQVRHVSHLRNSEERGKSDDGSSDERNKQMQPPNDYPDVSCLSEPAKLSDYHKSPTLVATSSVNHCDEEDQDPTEDMVEASDVPHPCEASRMSTQNLAHTQMALVITELVFYIIKKAKASRSCINPKSIIHNLLEKAKQQINPNKKSLTNVQNIGKIHKAVFKELVKKIGSAKKILKVMKTQVADCVFIDVLRIQLTSHKKKGCFASSLRKRLRI